MAAPTNSARPPAIPRRLRLVAHHALRVLDGVPGLSGSTVLVAVSGGPDSALLVKVMSLLAPRRGFHLRAAHINHNLSSAAATLQQHALEACRVAGVPCVVHSVTVPEHSGQGPEGAARAVRRDALELLARELRCQWIATGHNATDVAETFLQRVLEGAGRQGALRAVEGNRVRPLVALTRGQIRQAVLDVQLPAMDDPMNEQTELLRGHLRRRVWPVLTEKFGAPDRTLARAGQLAQEDDDALETMARRAWQPHIGADRQSLRDLPIALTTRALKQLAESVAGGPIRTGHEAVRKAAKAAVAHGGPVRQFKVGPVWLVVLGTHVVAQHDPSPRPSQRSVVKPAA
ncbi:MAG: tRNA lysidine(34) synthetase TilS [Myxococcota bacterium]